MTLEEQVLQKVAEWRLPSKQRQTLTVPLEDSGWTLHLTADRCDEVGCLLWETTLQRISPAADVTLENWARRITAQVHGLLEPLETIEIDSLRNEAQIRSNQPSKRGGELFYYEVQLKGNQSATVRRFKATGGKGRREQVAYALTHEVFARLVQDLAY